MTAPGPHPRGWCDGELEFRYAVPADIDHFAAMLAKPAVTEHVFFGPNTPAETRGFFAPLIEPMAAAVARGQRPTLHVLTVRREGAFVGQCAVVPIDYGDGNLEIGYQVDEPFWRQGVGSRMAALVAWLGVAVLGARRLSADTLADNAGSVRILEKLGFRREGVREGYYTKAGRPRDQVLYGVASSQLQLDLDAFGGRLDSL